MRDEKLYEGILRQVFCLPEEAGFIGGSVSLQIQNGIDDVLNNLQLTDKEMNLLENRLVHEFTYDECGKMYNESAQKAAATFRSIIRRIRMSEKFPYLLCGHEEGERQELIAWKLFEKQKDILNGAGYAPLWNDIKSLDVRYLTLLGLRRDVLLCLLENRCDQIEDVCKDDNLQVPFLKKKDAQHLAEVLDSIGILHLREV